jgi:hypothetical protein
VFAESVLSTFDLPEAPASVKPPARRRLPEVLRTLGPAIATLLVIASAWLVGKLLDLHANSNTGYWIGVVGGSAMLLLFTYPLRKRLKVMRNLGAPKYWFYLHMTLGILGPWLILVHCNFHIGSLNAGIALASMLIVALSGVAGRFLYVRIHYGLSGRKAELGELRAALDADNDSMVGTMAALPHALAVMMDFEKQSLAKATVLSGAPWRMVALWRRSRTVRRLVHQAIDADLKQLPRQSGDKRARVRVRHELRERTDRHLGMVLRVAEFAAWERLFALWHVAHVPFVYLMVLCALAHVAAVHIY